MHTHTTYIHKYITLHHITCHYINTSTITNKTYIGYINHITLHYIYIPLHAYIHRCLHYIHKLLSMTLPYIQFTLHCITLHTYRQYILTYMYTYIQNTFIRTLHTYITLHHVTLHYIPICMDTNITYIHTLRT